MPNYNFIDLSGKVFNRLDVLERVDHNRQYALHWKCKCTCGNVSIVSSYHLRSGHTRSCGCLQKEKIKQASLKHGLCDTSEYKIWDGILQRCQNPNNKYFKNYGGRGITVCDEWKNDFMVFFSDMGKRPSDKHSIERINNDKGYFPANCKWATRKEQSNNMRSNHVIVIHDIAMNLLQWAEFAGIKYNTALGRLKKGWSIEKSLFYPVRKR